MRFKDILKLSLFNIRRAKSRAFLTALSICVGVSSVMLITSLGDSGGAFISQEIDKIGLNGITLYSKNENILIEKRYLEAIKKNVPMAIDVQPLIIESGSYVLKNNSGNAIIWGIDSNADNVISLELVHGRLPNMADISQKGNVVVVDTELAMQMYKRTNIVGKKITVTVSNVSEKFEIIGVVSSQKDGLNQMLGGALPQFIYMPYTSLGNLRGRYTISQITIKCTNAEDNNKAGELAVSTLSRVSGFKNAFGYENINTHISRFKNISHLVTLLISAIAAISLFVAGLGIMNTMLASTGERKREIGIMMAIGARRKDIALCFMTESAIISGIGGLLGAMLGILMLLTATYLVDMTPVISLYKLIFINLISFICGIVFSILPAYRASKLNPVDILYE